LTLTGTAPGQFVTCTNSIQALATTANLTSIKYLYGIRTHFDIDLTNYKDVIVTFGWTSGGSANAFTGFLAKSTGGDTESWSTMGSVKVSLNLGTAGTIAFTDTSNAVLKGTSARFAFVMGSTTKTQALKNFTFKVEGTLATTLDSLSNPHFDHVGNYLVGDLIPHSAIHFTANYSLRAGGNTVDLTGASSGAIISNEGDLVDFADPFSYSTAGAYTLKITYTDPSGFGVQSITPPFTIEEEIQTLTGIYAIDSKSHSYYQYEFFDPEVMVYPLYNDEVMPSEGAMPFPEELFTCTVSATEPLKTAFDATWRYEYEAGLFFTSNIISYTVSERTVQSLGLAGYGATFFIGDLFSLGSLVVTSHWDVGPDTIIPYSSTQKDGYFTSSKAVGTNLNDKGTFDNTISYYAFSTETTASYQYSVEYELASLFQYYFSSDVPVLGVTSSVQTGAISATETLDNVVALGSDVSHTLTTATSNPTGNEADYYLTTDHLMLGTNSKGPQKVSISTPEVANASIDGVSYMAISKLRIDLQTTSVGSVTVSVGGVLPTSYQIDGDGIISASSGPTQADGNTHDYIFYLPYTVIGKVNFEITNNATPTPIGISFFAYAGFSYSPIDQAEAFGEMLNNGDSCAKSTYDNFLPTYIYLVTTGADTYLSDYTMTNHGNITAALLWSIIDARFEEPAGEIDHQIYADLADLPLSIVIISFVSLSLIGLYLATAKKAKNAL